MHYGLPKQKTKEDAKRVLLDAFASGSGNALAVPAEITELEGKLKLEFEQRRKRSASLVPR